MLKKDITKAIVENGVMVRRTLEEVVTIDGVNYRTDDPDAKQHGIYEFWYEEPNPPTGKKAQEKLVYDHMLGTVTKAYDYVDMTAAEINAPIFEQIAALELGQLMPRIVRDLAKKSLAEDAAANNITLEQLYAMADQGVPAGVAYKKFKDFDDQIATLRSGLLA